MNIIINVGNRESALSTINQISTNKYVPFDIRITNTHIVNLNKRVGKTLFRKDALYINSNTLWEITQQNGGRGSHNYHGITADDVLLALRELENPTAVFNTKTNRLAVITVSLSHFEEPLLVVIELRAPLRGKINANVYKIVTIYPKSGVDNYISQLDPKEVLYIKK